uniref:Hexosyltransferase n=1 Tax=Salix viminalis TaxID=40686 RepID=A0A6N2MTV7_SALVM
MVRTRLAWFIVGFSVSAAAISQFTWRDLSNERYALSYHMNQKFEDLEARVLNLESISPQNPNQTTQVDS